MRVDWCVSSWFRIKNSLSLYHRPAYRKKRERTGGGGRREFIELSSRKDESSDPHSDHLPPTKLLRPTHSRSFRMVLALGSPSGASLQLTPDC